MRKRFVVVCVAVALLGAACAVPVARAGSLRIDDRAGVLGDGHALIENAAARAPFDVDIVTYVNVASPDVLTDLARNRCAAHADVHVLSVVVGNNLQLYAVYSCGTGIPSGSFESVMNVMKSRANGRWSDILSELIIEMSGVAPQPTPTSALAAPSASPQNAAHTNDGPSPIIWGVAALIIVAFGAVWWLMRPRRVSVPQPSPFSTAPGMTAPYVINVIDPKAPTPHNDDWGWLDDLLPSDGEDKRGG